MKKLNRFALLAALVPCLALVSCAAEKKAAAVSSQVGTGTSSEPDKVLFERATTDIQHARYTEGRLALQTLINTYPDSEYLAKAKLAIADSYYKEGGTSGMTQAVAEYQDFITFFPFLDEASYAQMQIGMTHYRQMEKPDRDRNEAIEAEGAFQTYLQKYPNSPLSAQVEQRLREVQEILAEGDFRIAYFYYIRHVDKAAATRFAELTSRYPLYSQADRSNFMLASIYERTEHNDFAAIYYARVVRDYPLSSLAGLAKDKLVKLGAPVPPADPTALARMQKEQQTPRPRVSLISRPGALLKSGPNLRMAARTGTPTMTPEDDDNTETLTPGGNLAIGNPGATVGSAGSAAPGSGAFVETVTPGTSGSAASQPSAQPDAGSGAAVPNPSAGSPIAATSNGASATTPAATETVTTAAATDATAATGSTATDSSQPAAATDDSASPAATASKSESTSKKKKGIRKVLPF